MDTIQNIMQNVLKYISMANIKDAVDIFIMSLLFYQVFKLVRKSNAGRLLRGIVFVLLGFFFVELFELSMLSFMMSNLLQVGLLAIVIVFQPELRKILEQMGASNIKNIIARDMVSAWETAILQTTEACKILAWSREGALVVFERRDKLDDYIKTGTIINSDITAELVRNIFYPKAPLHDGAAIIQEARIAGAGCMLPLSSNQNMSRDLGMRHRAGVGMSENSDALVVIVSEETGSISVAVKGELRRHLTPESLEQILRKELIPDDETRQKTGPLQWLATFFRGDKDEN